MIEELKNEILNNIKYIKKEKDIQLIKDALNFALENHKNILHHDKSLYILHVLRVGLILTELHSDALCIAASFLSWMPFLTDITIEDIKENFGEEISSIAESIMNINKIKIKNTEEQTSIYLRKVLVGLSTDVRVIIIKLASRLDNLKHVYTSPSEIQKEKCLETQNVLIPIAHRLGINFIKSELEDLCLKYLKPEAYNDVLKKLDNSYEELNSYVDIMKEELSLLMEENSIHFKIKSRVKSVYSLYNKLSKGRKWNDIYDLLALRIIVKKKNECYLAIGLIHAKYRPIPHRFKDYIAQPKENMYQSLHTGVIGPNGKIFEIQIRTEDMDEIAECGIASHWSYKEQGSKHIQNLMERKLELFRDSLDLTNDDETVENDFKSLFIEEMIYCFTPKGDIIELPKDSTPVDFAYKIHSHIGDTLIGAIVNDEIVPIDYKLASNDIVKINTKENSTPNKDWLKFVRTTQAKIRIKSFFNKQDREEYILKGEELLNKEIKKRHLIASEVLNTNNINKILATLKLKDIDELKLSIGSLRYTASYILKLLEEEKIEVTDLILEKMSSNNTQKQTSYKNDIIVEGCDNVLVTMANCCQPVLGDDIVGYITKGSGIIVHKSSCSNLKNMESRFIDIAWNKTSSNVYSSRILIKTDSLNNNLLNIVTKSSQKGLTINSINTHIKETGIDYEILVKVPDIEVLKAYMTDLENLSFVKSVERENI